MIFHKRRLSLILTLALATIDSAILSASDDYELRMISNSPTYSQAIAINNNREIIGTREVTVGDISRMQNFFRTGEEELVIPTPNDFTNIEPEALSDSGVVVGYVSRPAGNPKGGIRGFAWNSKTKEMTILEPVAGDTSSNAQDISADGSRITGYCTGSEPPRVRPCVWQWNATSKQYEPQILSTKLDMNPFVQGARVVISPNGKRIASCITEVQLSEFVFDSSLVVWNITESGSWERTKLSEDQPKLKDINDHGVMVGVTSGELNGLPCRIDADGKIETLDLLPGDETGAAYGINNDGVIVGMSDDPRGGEGGPQAFICENGTVAPLLLLRQSTDSAALSINQNGDVAGFMLRESSDDAAVTAFLRLKKNK